MPSPTLFNRLSDAWNYKAPVLVSVPYFFALLGQMPVQQTIAAMFASYTTIIGIAAFGYFINDLTDIRQDALAQKPNSVARLSPMQRVVILVIILLVALLPWLYLPLTTLTAPFLLAQFLLFLAYSLPPMRLKERKQAGILTDALYAHVNPALLAALTFTLIIRQPLSSLVGYMAGLVTWQLLWGIRNILQHQLEDLENDIAAGVKTYAQSANPNKLRHTITHRLLPAELLAFALFLVPVTLQVLHTNGLILFIALAIFQYAALYFAKQLPSSTPEKATRFATLLYLVWLPFTLLLTAVIRDAQYLVLLALHLLLFGQMRIQLLSPFLFFVQYLYNEVPLPRYTLNEMVSELKQKKIRGKK